jgi:hypothetical protein
MSILNYTSKDVSEAIVRAEQLSLAISMVISQSSNEELKGLIEPLTSKLHSDLETLSSISHFVSRSS